MRGRTAGPTGPLGPLLAACVMAFTLQACLTLVGKRSQTVDITARPPGARVFVDGALRGEAPLTLELAKRPPHIIRIEKDGYRPVEIRLKKRKLWLPVVLGNLIWIPPIALWGFNPDAQTPRQEFAAVFFPVLAMCVSAGAMALDGASAKSTVLDPKHVTIALEKDEGERGPRVLEWDADVLRSVRWISLATADGPALR